MADNNDYDGMLNEFAQAGLEASGKFDIDPERHHYIRFGTVSFWFDDKGNLVRIERVLDPVKGNNRVLVCQPAKGRW
jgi:hypothetical protein